MNTHSTRLDDVLNIGLIAACLACVVTMSVFGAKVPESAADRLAKVAPVAAVTASVAAAKPQAPQTVAMAVAR